MVSVKSHPKILLWILILAGSSLWWSCSEPDLTFEPDIQDFSQATNKIWTLKLVVRHYTNNSSIQWFSNDFLGIFDSTLIWRSGHRYSYRSYELLPPILELNNGVWDYNYPQFDEPISTHALYGPYTYHLEKNGMKLSYLDFRTLNSRTFDYTFVNEYRDTLSRAEYYASSWQLETVSDSAAAQAMETYGYEMTFTPNHGLHLEMNSGNTPDSIRVDTGFYGVMNANQICLIPRAKLAYSNSSTSSVQKNDLRLRYIIFQSREISLEGDSLLHLSSVYGETTLRRKS